MNTCHICHTLLDGVSYVIEERYYGTKEKFLYSSCPNCMCLQLTPIPDDMEKYYPDNYYSMTVKKTRRHSPLLAKLRGFRLDKTLNNNPMKYFLTQPKLDAWMYQVNINHESKILDVGCGSGHKLVSMRRKGFEFLEGIDPFIDSDILYENGVVIRKTGLTDFSSEKAHQNSYNLIMMHHSLEHMPDQNAAFSSAHQLLSDSGKLLVRIPTCSSYAWEHYQERWVQADAPRHIYLHSNESIRMLAENHNFKLVSQYFDSTEFQFTGSERYMNDISLIDGNDEMFTKEKIKQFKESASRLNMEQRGDQTVLIFEKLVNG